MTNGADSWKVDVICVACKVKGERKVLFRTWFGMRAILSRALHAYGNATPATTLLVDAATSMPEQSFQFPEYAKHPAFYTIQPNLMTQGRQFALWRDLITSYCAHHHLYRLSLSSLPSDLFSKKDINRSLNQNDTKIVLTWMSKAENGGRLEWINASEAFVYWRNPAEFADMIYAWVDETGQKGAILTFYELRQSDAVRSQEWREMDEDLLRKVLNVLVKKGKAQIFGQEESAGIKFF